MINRAIKIGYYFVKAIVVYLLLLLTRKKAKSCLIHAHFTSSGGTRTYFFSLVEYLSKKHYNITVLLKKEQIDNEILELQIRFPFEIREINFDLQSNRFTGTVFYKKNQDDFIYQLKELVFCWNCLRKTHSSLFIISEAIPELLLFQFLSPVKLIYILHTVATNPLEKLKICLLKNCISSKKLILTVSEYAKKLLLQNWTNGKHGERIHVIHNFYEPRTENNIPIKYSGKRVLSIGTVASYKKPLFWIAVCKEVMKQYRGEISFVWAGDGELLEECKASSKDFDNIKFIGVQKNVEQLYMDCDLYFQPSLLESHGIAVVGAMYFQKACVVSDRQGLPESVINNLTGLVVPVENTAASVEAIVSLLNDPIKAIEFGKAGRQRFETSFTKNKWSSQMDELFN